MEPTRKPINKKRILKFILFAIIIVFVSSSYYYLRFYRDSDAISEYKRYIGKVFDTEQFSYNDFFRDNVTRFQYEHWNEFEEAYNISDYIIIEGLANVQENDSVWVTIDDSKNRYISFNHGKWYQFKETVSDEYAEYLSF